MQSGGFFGLDSCHQNSVLIRRFCLTPCSGDNLKNVPFAILSVLLIAVMKEKIRSKDTECNTNLASNTSQSIEHVKKKAIHKLYTFKKDKITALQLATLELTAK